MNNTTFFNFSIFSISFVAKSFEDFLFRFKTIYEILNILIV